MNDINFSVAIFVVFFGIAVFCMRLRKGLPEHHLSGDTKDAIRVGMSLVATMSALVLGLLISSTKAAYDTERSEVTQMASKIMYLDRLLAEYGPQTETSRAMLHQLTESAVQRIWPEAAPTEEVSTAHNSLIDELRQSIVKLKPESDDQLYLKAQALADINDAAQMHWLLVEQQGSAIPTPLLIVVIVWLSIIFASIGLFAPMNMTSTAGLLLAALSVAGAIFLILELDQPFSGLIHISREPMLRTLSSLGH